MTPMASLRNAFPLVAALAAFACGGGTERPEPPSPPPIQTQPSEAATRPRPAPHPVAQPESDARSVPPSEASRSVEAAPSSRPEPATAKPATVAPEAAPPDPLRWMEDRKAREEAARVRLAAAEKAVEDAKARVVELENRLLAVKNPFLPRPALPPEEAAAWEGLDGVERAKRVEGQLAEARAELERAQQALAAIRARGPVS